MRKFLSVGLLVITIVLAACGEEKSDTPATTDETAEVILGNTSLTPEENRLPFVLRQGVQRYRDAKIINVKARDMSQQGEPTIWEGRAEVFRDADGPYYVVYPEITHAGQWLFEFTVETGSNRSFQVSEVTEAFDAPLGLTVGQAAYPSETITGAGLEKLEGVITTDVTPNPAYYQQTVAQAVTSGKPSLIIFATPELCTRNLCGPVVDSLDPIYDEYQDQLNFVHVETYNLETGQKVPAIAEWGLVLTPWLYLVDADGTIAYRVEGVFSAEEIAPYVEELLG